MCSRSVYCGNFQAARRICIKRHYKLSSRAPCYTLSQAPVSFFKYIIRGYKCNESAAPTANGSLLNLFARNYRAHDAGFQKNQCMCDIQNTAESDLPLRSRYSPKRWRGEKLDQRSSAYYYSPTGVERKDSRVNSAVAYLKQSEKVKLVHALSMTEREVTFQSDRIIY